MHEYYMLYLKKCIMKLRKSLSMPAILKRELFHIVAGLSIPIAALFLPRIVLLISLGVGTFIFFTYHLGRLRKRRYCRGNTTTHK